MTPNDIQQINEVRFKVISPSQTFDVDSLFHFWQVSFHQEQRTFWYLIITTVCVLEILGILCFYLRSHIHRYIVKSLHQHHYQTQYCYSKSFASNSRTNSKNSFSKKQWTSMWSHFYGLSTKTSRVTSFLIRNKMVASKSPMTRFTLWLKREASQREDCWISGYHTFSTDIRHLHPQRRTYQIVITRGTRKYSLIYKSTHYKVTFTLWLFWNILYWLQFYYCE